jgi:hypothetical protein
MNATERRRVDGRAPAPEHSGAGGVKNPFEKAADETESRAPEKGEEPDEEFDVKGQQWPQIPKGEYFGCCYNARFVTLFKFGASGRVFLDFKIYRTRESHGAGDEPFAVLYFVAAVPGEWDKKAKKFIKQPVSRSSRLYAAYCTANGHEARRDRLSLKAFRGKLFRVLVRDVESKSDKDGNLAGPLAPYSVVDRLLERLQFP